MAGAAAALLRSVARRSKTPILMGAGSLPRPQPHPQAASAVLSPRLLFDGGLRRRQELPPMATSARLFSSDRPGSPDKNLSPPCTEPAVGIEDKNKELSGSPSNKLPIWELQKQIVSKQGELLQLLLQLHGGTNSSLSESKKCLEEKEQLLHLLQEFHAKTGKETSEFPGVVRFLTSVGFFFIFVSIFVSFRM